MSREYNQKNKQQKVDFSEYLYSPDEPQDYSANDSTPELEARLLESSYFIRRRFRHLAKEIRPRYS